MRSLCASGLLNTCAVYAVSVQYLCMQYLYSLYSVRCALAVPMGSHGRHAAAPPCLACSLPARRSEPCIRALQTKQAVKDPKKSLETELSRLEHVRGGWGGRA